MQYVSVARASVIVGVHIFTISFCKRRLGTYGIGVYGATTTLLPVFPGCS